jgi:hypothetical protein
MRAMVMKPQDISGLEQLFKGGELMVVPTSFYRSFTQEQIACFGHTHALYCLPTVELIEWLRAEIGERSAIEIGAGQGAIGRALGIPRTDSRIQERPDVALYYEIMGQPTTACPPDVETLEALAAVEKYRPQVVIGSWITQKYMVGPKMRQNSSVYGPDEEEILERVELYIHIGHKAAHGDKRIINRLLTEHPAPSWYVSRSLEQSGNVVQIFRGKKYRGGGK